ncbi:hypothetical protein JTB14_018955 [Gonioctena quinquepunctata]|nr:hypothetical protein JTB14_018955 [Gonioctena quinquepunctata]
MRKAITAEERLIVTLRYLATGRSLEDLKFSAIISPQALGNIIPETCDCIYKALKKKYLKFPNTVEEWEKIARDYNSRWNFPNCGGSIDGSNLNQANIYTAAETNKKHPAGTSNDTCTMYTIMESRQAYQQELSKSNNGRQSCHASVNYQVYNPNETNIYTTAENIVSGNDTSYNEHAAGPSNDTTFNIRTENNSHQASRQDLSEFVTFQK